MTALELMAAGTALGVVHAFEADHLAAVSVFVSRRPGRREAVGYGVRWAVGHGAAVVAAGAVLGLVGGTWLASTSAFMERLVGVAMVALGAWTILGAARASVQRHRHDRGREHAHVVIGAGHHEHGLVSGIGVLHGLAGATPVLALIPISGVDSRGGILLYLICFAVGTTLAMGLYAVFAGWLLRAGGRRGDALVRVGMGVAGAASLAVGILWLTHG